MSMMLQVVQVLSLLLVATAMSFALAHAAELPGKRRLDRDTYLAIQSIYHPGFTVGGISEPASIAALAVLLVLTPRETAAFGWTCAALVSVVGMQAVYWLVTHPVNRFWLKGQALPGASARFFAIGGDRSATASDPTDWVRLRDRWEYSHLLRACLGIGSLVFLAIAVTT